MSNGTGGIFDLRSQVSGLRSDLKRTNNELEAARNHIQTLESQLANARADLRDMQTEFAECQRERVALDARLARAETSEASLRQNALAIIANTAPCRNVWVLDGPEDVAEADRQDPIVEGIERLKIREQACVAYRKLWLSMTRPQRAGALARAQEAHTMADLRPALSDAAATLRAEIYDQGGQAAAPATVEAVASGAPLKLVNNEADPY